MFDRQSGCPGHQRPDSLEQTLASGAFHQLFHGNNTERHHSLHKSQEILLCRSARRKRLRRVVSSELDDDGSASSEAGFRSGRARGKAARRTQATHRRLRVPPAPSGWLGALQRERAPPPPQDQTASAAAEPSEPQAGELEEPEESDSNVFGSVPAEKALLLPHGASRGTVRSIRCAAQG